jgi:hypothetical protein
MTTAVAPKIPLPPAGTPPWAIAAFKDLAGWVFQMLRRPVRMPSYTVAEVALLTAADYFSSASGNAYSSLIFVSNESGGSVPAFSDGSKFRRVTDRAIVS